MSEKFKQFNVSSPREKYTTEEEVRELIAASLANWTGITRFRTIETTLVSLSDFTDAQHNHTGTSGGGQLTDAALSSAVTVPKGGTGQTSLTSGAILKGNGAGAVAFVVPLAGAKTYWVSDTNGGATTRKLTFTDGVLTAET